MKKLICITLSFLCLAMLCSICAAAEASSDDALTFEIPYGTPEIDGVISDGEYHCEYLMNGETASAWVGEVGDSCVELHFAWDEQGLYYAGTINDSTPAYRDENTHWVGTDCIELSINPSELLNGDRAEGIFFSFGATEDGKIVAYRHNYADGLVSDIIIGKATGHTEGSDSYTIEVCLPWSLIQIDEDCTVGGKKDIHIDSTGFVPEGGAKLGLLPCAIDSVDVGKKDPEITAAYKFNGTDFTAKDFISATLLDKPASENGTELSTENFTENTTENATENGTVNGTEILTEGLTEGSTKGQTDTASSSGCGSIVSVGALALPTVVLVAVAFRKKVD